MNNIFLHYREWKDEESGKGGANVGMSARREIGEGGVGLPIRRQQKRLGLFHFYITSTIDRVVKFKQTIGCRQRNKVNMFRGPGTKISLIKSNFTINYIKQQICHCQCT